MGYSIGYGKKTFEIMSRGRLPLDVRVALAEFRNQLKQETLGLEIFWNGDFDPRRGRAVGEAVLPTLRHSHGRKYVEGRVGRASAPTERDPNRAGVRRLVAELDAGSNVRRVFFTDGHYRAGTWFEIR